FRYTFVLPDDGPWPGNGTSSDKLTIRATYGSVVRTFDVKIKNVQPQFVAAPVFWLGTVAAGTPIARVTGQLGDDGRVDVHTASVKWSGGKTTTTKDSVSFSLGCGPEAGRKAILDRELEAGGRVYPVEVRIADDDHPAD